MMRVMVLRSLCFAVMLGAVATQTQQAASAIKTRLTYTLSQEANPGPVWKIVIVGKEFTRPPRLRLDSWGDWHDYEKETHAHYLRNLKSRPEARNPSLPEGTLEFVDGPNWNGSFEVSYEIPLFRVGSGGPLLPTFSGANSCGFAINTLMDLVPDSGIQNGRTVERLVKIIPPNGASIATGWRGVTMGTQEIRLTGPIANTPIVIGLAAPLRREKRNGIAYEVAQFGGGSDRTSEVLKTAQTVVPRYEKDTGLKRGRPVRLFLFDGAQFNTHTPSAILLSYRASEEFSARSRQIMAHELFHDWLGAGGFIEADESIAWFHEGFTDYFSLWYTTATGLVDREWFAKRLEGSDMIARSSSAYGKVAFAGDGARWRTEGYETLAYRGAAVLAFLTDVELRKRRQPGLMQMIRDLGRAHAKGAITIDQLALWLKSHNLTDFYERYYQGKALPEISESLKSIGFVPKEVAAELTYFGIRNEEDRVVEIDPEGPAALAGVRVGDLIYGYFPTRQDRPRDIDKVNTRFAYGLDLVEPGNTGTYLDIKRRGQSQFSLPIQPRLIRGGHTKRYLASGKELDRFFSFQPNR
ncbi:MAG: hypothetical protein ABI923_02030 [bacterium]